MFHSIHIEGYRGLQNFEMSNLARVNLLVGKNNSGKTSVLEAIYLLAMNGNPWALWDVSWRRGEVLPPRIPNPHDQVRIPPIECDISHLFHNHQIKPGSLIRISAENHSGGRSVEYTIDEVALKEQEAIGRKEPAFVIRLMGTPKPVAEWIPMSPAGGMIADLVAVIAKPGFRDGPSSAQLITVESIATDQLIAMWNRVQLTPAESLVLQALQSLDPAIERIAAQPVPGAYLRGGFIVKLKDSERPVPIGSLGDGMWRMFAMAIAITQCRGGALLVDEIDTGLHFRVMSQMWKLIFNAAKQFDVQVFATTHSSDCVYSLADLQDVLDRDNTFSVQRIESGNRLSVPYDQDEILVAAEREIEVR